MDGVWYVVAWFCIFYLFYFYSSYFLLFIVIILPFVFIFIFYLLFLFFIFQFLSPALACLNKVAWQQSSHGTVLGQGMRMRVSIILSSLPPRKHLPATKW